MNRRARPWLLGLVLAASACLQGPDSRPPQDPHQPYETAARQGMVVAAHPLAARVGLDALKRGGNAVDAAVATWAAQGLVEPQMTGLGGDAFILIYLAKTGEVKFINGTGPAPQRATLDFYKERGGIPQEGALASDVPGALDGIGIALEKYGTQTYKQVLEPAIELAERGLPVSYVLAGVLESNRETMGRFPSTTALWFRDGRPLRAGEIVVQKGYGETLKKIAAGGRRVFYDGEVAVPFTPNGMLFSFEIYFLGDDGTRYVLSGNSINNRIELFKIKNESREIFE